MTRYKLVTLVFTILLLSGVASAAELIIYADHDGYVGEGNPDAVFPILRNATGDLVTNNEANYIYGGRTASTTTAEVFDTHYRGLVTFTNSTLNSSCVISAATLSVYGAAKGAQNGEADFNLIDVTPINSAVYVAGDYKQTTYTRLAENISYASFSTSGYNTFTLNSAGLAAINTMGNSTFMFTHSADTNITNLSLTWASAGTTRFILRSTAYDSGSVKPYLTITYTVTAPTPTATISTIDWPWCADQDIFFRADSSDIAGYFHMDHRPQIESTKYFSTTVSSGTGSQRIASWATNASKPGVSVIGPGLWRFRVYLNVSSAVGNTNYEFKVFNRSSDGTETDLFYGHVISKDINDLTPTEHLISYARRNYTQLFSGDRLVIKVNASTSSVAARDAWISVAGNTQASMVGVSYFICDTGCAYQLQEAPASPAIPLLATVIGILFIVFKRGKK